ncbi:hypothetical protein KP509_07G027500 [Ceratopteris richardii]|uniref:Uncharacterized protein n=1 Tax=Ceratopteris richardii TaxID=49495 RepID=A0A8T2UJM8_CERRI|nr:hypothetical protein KP509_07G027500 [Ceratopteris richardii]
MELSGSSHEEIIACNVLTRLSSSALDRRSLAFLGHDDLSLSERFSTGLPLREKNVVNHSSRCSSESFENYTSAIRGEIRSGKMHEFPPLDDEMIKEKRTKLVPSLQNCEVSSRFAISRLDKTKSPNSLSSRLHSKILVAAKTGPKAWLKPAHYYHNKENKGNHGSALQVRESDGASDGQKGVKKRKSPDHGGNAHLSVLRERSVPPENVAPDTNSITTTSTLDNRDQRIVTKKAKLPVREEFRPLLEPSDNSKEQSSFLTSDNTERVESNPSLDKEEVHKALHIGKHPTYPNFKQNTSVLVDGRCSSNPSVNGFRGEEKGAPKSDDKVISCSRQTSSPLTMEGQEGPTNMKEESVLSVGKVGGFCVDTGNQEDFQMEEPCTASQNNILQVNAASNVSVTTQEMSALPCFPVPCGLDRVIVLTNSEHVLNDQTISNGARAAKSTETNQDDVTQGSMETNSHIQFVPLSCETALPKDFSASIKEDAKASVQNLHEPQKRLQFSSTINDHRSRRPPAIYRGASMCFNSQYSGVGLPKLRRGRPPRKSNLCPCPEVKQSSNRYTQVCAPVGVLGKLNPGIITRLRDRKQVYAILENVIKGAFMSGTKECLKLQGAKETGGDDGSFQCMRDRALDSAAQQRPPLELSLADQDTVTLTSKTELGMREELAVDVSPVVSANEDSASLTTRLPKKEESYSKGPNEDMDNPRHASALVPEAVTLNSERSIGNRNQNRHHTAENENKNIENDGPVAIGNVASCWLELLRLDIKGRLSALRRSKRRVRGVITSGQLDTTHGEGIGTTKTDEMTKWRGFFLHMEQVLCLEGTRLESWLNQITEMQLSYCQISGQHIQGNMPPVCSIGTWDGRYGPS